MNGTTTIQVRVSVTLKTRSQQRAAALGFSSVQEAIRVFLSSFSLGRVRPGIVTDVLSEEGELVKLSPRAKRRYQRIARDFDQKKNIASFSNVDDALAWLNQ